MFCLCFNCGLCVYGVGVILCWGYVCFYLVVRCVDYMLLVISLCDVMYPYVFFCLVVWCVHDSLIVCCAYDFTVFIVFVCCTVLFCDWWCFVFLCVRCLCVYAFVWFMCF